MIDYGDQERKNRAWEFIVALLCILMLICLVKYMGVAKAEDFVPANSDNNTEYLDIEDYIVYSDDSYPSVPAEIDNKPILSVEVVCLTPDCYMSMGGRIHLRAISPCENISYQWQQNDGTEWISIPNETSPDFHFIVTEANYHSSWRVFINYI